MIDQVAVGVEQLGDDARLAQGDQHGPVILIVAHHRGDPIRQVADVAERVLALAADAVDEIGHTAHVEPFVAVLVAG